MTSKVTNNAGIQNSSSGIYSTNITKTSTENETPKTNVFKKEVSDPLKTSLDKEKEREVYILYLMKTKNVSREVAASEYDSFC